MKLGVKLEAQADERTAVNSVNGWRSDDRQYASHTTTHPGSLRYSLWYNQRITPLTLPLIIGILRIYSELSIDAIHARNNLNEPIEK